MIKRLGTAQTLVLRQIRESCPIFKRMGATGLPVKDYQDVIHVNQVGLRFVNEMAEQVAWFNPCLAMNGRMSNGGGPIWVVFDADAAKREKWTCEPPRVHDSLSGVRINAKTEIIDLLGQVIPGLYCSGESAGGFNLHGLGRCMVQGGIAGREAANYGH